MPEQSNLALDHNITMVASDSWFQTVAQNIGLAEHLLLDEVETEQTIRVHEDGTLEVL